MEDDRRNFDIAIAWNWVHDTDFIHGIESAARKEGLTTFLVHRDNVEDVTDLVKRRRLHFRWYLDRASDEEESFLPLARLILRRYRSGEDPEATRLINPHDHQKRASDKATMHLEFLTNGIEVPYTIIISPFNHKQEVELSLSELAKLGRPFIIKPANTTGGGIGVVMGAESLKEVIEARQAHKNDKYLLQETIRPVLLGTHRAWFRAFYAFGETHIAWWDDRTHIYEDITPEDEGMFGLARLREVTLRIQSVTGLDFFSTELAITGEERVVAVDYVNEICDMRLQSRVVDGVPDHLVARMVDRMIGSVKRFPGQWPLESLRK